MSFRTGETRPRVVHLTPGFPAHSEDDVCIPALQDFVEGLVLRSAPACHRVVSMHYPAQRSSYLWKDVAVHTVGCRSNLLLRVSDWRRVGALLMQLHKEQPIDVLHAYFLSDAALVAARFAARARVPLVVTAMGQDVLPSNRYLGLLHRLELFHGWTGWRRAAAHEALTPNASRQRSSRQSAEESGEEGGACVYIAPSQRCAALLRETALGKNRVEVVPWGVRSVDAPPSRTQRDIDFLGVGSLTSNKDYALLVRLGHHLRNDSECARKPRIVLLGDGPQRNLLERLVTDLELSSCVEIKGQKSRRETRRIMTKARVLIHPSRYESFAMVFAEAAAAGMSIVSRAVGCAPHRSVPGWSLFDDPGDLPELARASLKGPALDMRFPLENACRGYENLYAELLSASGAPCSSH